jgi:hypothetical protein
LSSALTTFKIWLSFNHDQPSATTTSTTFLPGYWYSLEDEDHLFTTVLATARPNQFQYKTLLLSSTILYRFGNSVRFSQARLDYLKVTLEQQQNMTIHITRANVHGRKTNLHGQP